MHYGIYLMTDIRVFINQSIIISRYLMQKCNLTYIFTQTRQLEATLTAEIDKVRICRGINKCIPRFYIYNNYTTQNRLLVLNKKSTPEQVSQSQSATMLLADMDITAFITQVLKITDSTVSGGVKCRVGR